MQSSPEYLYMTDEDGNLDQFSISKKKIQNSYENLHSEVITTLARTHDNKYIFTADRLGFLKQININTEDIKDYKQIVKSWIVSLAITSDILNQRLLVAYYNGNQVKIDINEKKVAKNYGQVTTKGLSCMEITPCDRFLFIGSSEKYDEDIDESNEFIEEESTTENKIQEKEEQGYQKKICIKTGEVLDKTQVFENDGIFFIKITADSKFTFVATSTGSLKQLCFSTQKIQYDFGQLHENEISFMIISPDDQYLLTGDDLGVIIRFDMKTNQGKKTMVSEERSLTCACIIGEFAYVGDTESNLVKYSLKSAEVVEILNDFYTGPIESLI